MSVIGMILRQRFRYAALLLGAYMALLLHGPALAQHSSIPWPSSERHLRLDSIVQEKGIIHYYAAEWTVDTIRKAGPPAIWVGYVQEGTKGELLYQIHNPYSDTLFLSDFKTQTGCNSPERCPSWIAPEHSAWISIRDNCLGGQLGVLNCTGVLKWTLGNTTSMMTLRYEGWRIEVR